jgi:hypothetical protein
MAPADTGNPRGLFKTEIVIWSKYPGTNVELSRLAREAESGGAYCSAFRSALVPVPGADQDWDGTEFFGPVTSALLLCDGCFEAATGLLAECADGCAQPLDHDGECLREGPAECQWCGLADRLHAVSRADVAGRLPAAGEDGDGLWFLHWEDDYQGPYPSRDAAWADWHATAAARLRPAPTGT